MPNYEFEAEEAYKTTLDLNKALEEGERMADIQAKKRQETASTQYEAVGEEKIEVAFKCEITRTQAKALAEFCKDNGIRLIKLC